ncbi:MAG: hypothetical protein K0U98_26575 [Deltaproteobacteria bacterium]|nr:hypothetical protein [Deltaproteobacteria bacterium]
MNHRNFTFLVLGVAVLAVIAAATLIVPPVEAGGCSSCGGPTRTVVGQGSGNSCTEAGQRAEADANQKAFADLPACLPCQTSAGPMSCSTPSCFPGPCPPNSYNASLTLQYKCKSCDPGMFDPSF